MELDYGSQGKATLKKFLVLPSGSSVVDATRAVAKVQQGVVCCDPRDVEAIDRVKCDPANKTWWIYDLNGKKGQVSAFRCLLVEGDRVTWHYKKVKITGLKKTISCPVGVQ